MSEAAPHPTPDYIESEHTEGPHGSFFDSNLTSSLELVTPEEIDLTPIQRSGMEKNAFDARTTARFILESTRGKYREGDFEAVYSNALSTVLENAGGYLSNEAVNTLLADMYEVLEESVDNTWKLLKIIRDKHILPQDEFVTVNKLCIFILARLYPLPGPEE